MRLSETTRPLHTDTRSLLELAAAFLKLGLTAFGGPAAHIAMMENEFVRRRQWLSREEFLDLLGAANLIPGPSSSELAIYIGQRRSGWRGLLVAGLCFILPAAFIVLIFAALYVRYGSLPAALGILEGIKPVIIAILLQALLTLGRGAIKNRYLLILFLAAAALNAWGLGVLVVLFGSGLLAAIPRLRVERSKIGALVMLGGFLVSGQRIYASAIETARPSLLKLFLVFLKVGAVQYGSGYVLLAFLRADLVEKSHWLGQGQLLDAIAVGQFTPGPVFTTATFIGFILHGMKGAALATIGIFLPAFILVAVSGRLIPLIRRSPVAGAFLDGVIVASLALMAVVSWQLGKAAFVDIPTVLLGLVSLVLLLRFRINSAWLVLMGGVFGLLRMASLGY